MPETLYNQFYLYRDSVVKLIDRLFKNKEGFIKEKVTLARTGAMEYLGAELGMGLNPDEVYQVYVEADELFKPDVLESANGATATMEHPDTLEVTVDGSKDGWKTVAVGHVQDIYQDGEFLKGTIFVKDQDSIRLIEEFGIKEVSLGYDSDIIEKDDKLVKTNIRVNHLAIVPEGRCGSECKIGDSKKVKTTMFKKHKLSLADSIAKIVGSKTSQQKAIAKKFGDARKGIKGAKSKLGDSVRKKLSDLEEVMQNPQATDEEKQVALEAVTTISEDIAAAIDILDGADDSVSEAEAAVEDIPVGDATLPEGVSLESLEDGVKQYIADLEAEVESLKADNEEKDTRIKELEDELAALKNEGETSTAVADAKARFPKLKLGDSYKSQRQVQQAVLVAKGAYTDAQAAKLSDCSISAAYQALAVSEPKPTSSFGKKMFGDAKKEKTLPLSFQRKGK